MYVLRILALLIFPRYVYFSKLLINKFNTINKFRVKLLSNFSVLRALKFLLLYKTKSSE